MTRTFDLTGKSAAALSLKGKYSIEAGYDYLYFEASTDGGKTWIDLDGTANGTPIGVDGAGRPALAGTSNGAWADINIPLTAVAGKVAQVRLHYVTDGGVSEGGFFGDAITVTADGQTVLSDGAETDAGLGRWTSSRWSGRPTPGVFDNYYIAGNRSYVSYDKYLKTGPYFFGYANTRPDWVDHYAYQEGLLISYWNTRWADNNTFVAPG